MGLESNFAGNGRLLTVLETMAALRVGRTKLYELINAGAIEVVKFGKRSTRVKVESVERLQANGIVA
jgi:excisionase family DNA binding protein